MNKLRLLLIFALKIVLKILSFRNESMLDVKCTNRYFSYRYITTLKEDAYD